MAPLLLIPALALILAPLPARAEGARQQAGNAAVLSESAVTAGDDTATREAAARPFDANVAGDTVVVAPGVTRAATPLARATPGSREDAAAPPAVVGQESGGRGKLTSGLVMAGSAVLGGLQGWFAAGLVGAAAGIGLGLAAAWLFHKKNYGAAFGVTAGAIVGTALGGPIGGVIGAAVGGLIGHFLGKLFL